MSEKTTQKQGDVENSDNNNKKPYMRLPNKILTHGHSIIVFVLASWTLYNCQMPSNDPAEAHYGIPTYYSVIVSVFYFAVTPFFEDHGNPSTHIHHLICFLAAAYSLPYPRHGAWITLVFQTNEISTPFFHIFNEYKYKAAGFMFLFTFFISRIVINSVFFLPVLYTCLASLLTRIANGEGLLEDYLEIPMLINSLFFYILQWYWWVKIVAKFRRLLKEHLKKQKEKQN